MENYEILGQVGEGSFGQVYKAMRHIDGEIVALKIIRKVREIYDINLEYEKIGIQIVEK